MAKRIYSLNTNEIDWFHRSDGKEEVERDCQSAKKMMRQKNMHDENFYGSEITIPKVKIASQ